MEQNLFLGVMVSPLVSARALRLTKKWTQNSTYLLYFSSKTHKVNIGPQMSNAHDHRLKIFCNANDIHIFFKYQAKHNSLNNNSINSLLYSSFNSWNYP